MNGRAPTERELAALRESLNAAFPADNHETLDERMRVMMMTLSQDSPIAVSSALRPVPARVPWLRRLFAGFRKPV